MKTELNVSDPVIIGGKQIEMDRIYVKNFRDHKMLQMISRTQIFILECDSNNATSTVSARDIKKIRLAWDNAKAEWARAKKYRNTPSGVLEKGYEIYLPKRAEIQAINNIKLQSVAQELDNFSHVAWGTDSAQMQQWVGESATADIDEAAVVVDEVMLEVLGTGDPKEDSLVGFDVGMQAPDFSRCGTLIPDVDGDTASLAEPAAGEVSPPPVPDVADSPSDVAKK